MLLSQDQEVDILSTWLDQFHLNEVVFLEFALLYHEQDVLDDECIILLIPLDHPLPSIERPWEPHPLLCPDRVRVPHRVLEPFTVPGDKVKYPTSWLQEQARDPLPNTLDKAKLSTSDTFVVGSRHDAPSATLDALHYTVAAIPEALNKVHWLLLDHAVLPISSVVVVCIDQEDHL